MNFKLEYYEINGKKQCIGIIGGRNDLPILFYLHGGPGETAIPLIMEYNKNLVDYFTVIVWEQRGSGMSFYEFDHDVTISTFVEDAIILIKKILSDYEKNNLILVGHSWGSVLGLNLITLRPDLVSFYIGIGQVVNMKDSSRIGYECVKSKAIQNNESLELEKICKIDPEYTASTWHDDLNFINKLIVKYGGSIYGASTTNEYFKIFMSSSIYDLNELLKRQNGIKQSYEALWHELMLINFEKRVNFKVPVAFIEGINDFHVSSHLAVKYFDSIETRKKLFLFNKSAHYPHWSEPNNFLRVCLKLLKEFSGIEF